MVLHYLEKTKDGDIFQLQLQRGKLKEEEFIKNINFINDVKVRLGVGKTGQQDITGNVGFYPSTPLFTIGSNNSQYLDNSNLYSALVFNEDLTWEKTTTYNLGIDFDLFKNNFLSGSFDIYRRETTDLLARVPLPPGQGLSDTFIKNVGSTESKGFELSLNFKPVKTDISTQKSLQTQLTVMQKLQILKITANFISWRKFTYRNKCKHCAKCRWLPTILFLVFQQLYDGNGSAIPELRLLIEMLMA